MGLAYIEGGGGGGISSSDVTALKANILEGTYDIAADSADEVVQGTMPNNGAVNQSLAINGTYTIPAGYHNGSGKVTQSITTKAAATYYPTTSDQSIAGGQYLTGAQTIKAVSQQNLSAGNIKKGVTVYVKNGNGNIYAVTGTFEGYVPSANSVYYHGQNIGNLAYYGSSAKYATFTSDGILFSGQTGTANMVGYCLGSKTMQINGNTFSNLTITGNLVLDANAVASTYGLYVYVDLMNSSADYSNLNAYSLRLGTYRYTNSASIVTLSSIVVPLNKQSATGYIRVWFQGFYVDGSSDNTRLGYSLGYTNSPATVSTIVLS